MSALAGNVSAPCQSLANKINAADVAAAAEITAAAEAEMEAAFPHGAIVLVVLKQKPAM